MRQQIIQYINDILTSPHNTLEANKPIIDNLVRHLCDITDIELHPEFFHDEFASITTQGKAVSMTTAAQCAEEYMRTQVFIRGVHQALNDQLKDKETVKVLYAGTGPFGLLLIPLLPFFSAKQLDITLLDIHPESLDALDKLMEHLKVKDHINHIHCIDILNWSPAPDSCFDLIISETMKAMLDQEPQVSIFAHLSPYLSEQGHLIPKQILIEAWLEDHLNSDTTKIGDVFTLDHASSLALNQQSIPDISTTLAIPDYHKGDCDLKFTTCIQVYQEHSLGERQCSLNLPYFIRQANPEPGSFLKCQYRFGRHPGFEFDYKKCKSVAEQPLPEYSDRSILGLPCLNRIWHKAQRNKAGSLCSELRKNEWDADMSVFNALGFNTADIMQILFQSPTQCQLEKHLLNKNNGDFSLQQRQSAEACLSNYSEH